MNAATMDALRKIVEAMHRPAKETWNIVKLSSDGKKVMRIHAMGLDRERAEDWSGSYFQGASVIDDRELNELIRRPDKEVSK